MTEHWMPLDSSAQVAEALRGRRWVSAELMYKPRPTEPRERQVFDFALASRLTELSRYDDAGVVWIGNDQMTLDSLAHLRDAYPRLRMAAAVVNPEPVSTEFPDLYAETPRRCAWEMPERWRRYELTDRWARIVFALDMARQWEMPGYLILPAQDALWGQGLLALLARLSERYARGGLPAAVSPYSPLHHSTVPGVHIPPEIIDALNAAFARDSWLRWRLASGHYQGFWGKTGLLPFGMCGALRERVETMVWEDDLEIDRVIREAGCGVYCQWISRAALYRQALPVFDRAGLYTVIERTLHYSLNIPGKTYGEKSLLNQPLDTIGHLRRKLSPRFARAMALSESMIAECNAACASRLERFGMSWVDWGAYRYVVRVGDPLVQVWKCARDML